MKMLMTIFLTFFMSHAKSTPLLQMDRAFNALMELMPFMMKEDQFKDKKNEKIIELKIK